jgi:hypothetical protein
MIDILGKERKVKFSFYALRKFKELTGLELLSLSSDNKIDLEKELQKIEVLSVFVYCALLAGDLSFDHTLEEVENEMDITFVTDGRYSSVLQAWFDFLGVKSDGKEIKKKT